MPNPAYLSLEGVKQGNISKDALSDKSLANSAQDHHVDEILVEAFRHEITLPTDPQSGQPSGQRVHRQVVITKMYDRSSPLLYNALVSGERMKKVTIKWFRTAKDGTEEHYFTHELEDAVIVNITAYMPNCQDPAMASFTHLEDVSFSYRKIKWSHVPCGTEGQDDWKVARP